MPPNYDGRRLRLEQLFPRIQVDARGRAVADRAFLVSANYARYPENDGSC